ncbi:MAG: Mpo1-like protein [Myxococcaceae bacterium]
MSERIQSFEQFWPYYLGEHSRPGTRLLHLVGTTLAICLLLSAVTTGRWLLLIAALVCGYAFAWVGHFFVEHNRPATFRYPFWSLAADFRMWWAALTGRLQSELQRAHRPL